MSWLVTGAGALVLAGAHVAGAIRKPSSDRLRSFAGGVGSAYVFAVILPVMSGWQRLAYEELEADRSVFLLALAGFAAFYVLEVSAAALDERRQGHSAAWVETGGFACYSLAVGFVLADYGERSMGWLLGYIGAIGLHFYMTARSTAGERHTHVSAKWLLAGSVLAGWIAGVLIPDHGRAAAFLFAAMAGAMILNILKDELPTRRKAMPTAFLLGVGCVTALTLIPRG